VAHQVVEGGTQIISDISDASRDVSRASDRIQKTVGTRNSLRDGDLDVIRRVIRSLSVTVSNNYCSAFCSQDVGCQVFEVLFGPLNFYANENDSFVGSKQRELLSSL
jgi:hypothetical protein